MSERIAEIVRKTRETDIRLRLDLDGSGRSEIASGVGFLDHMLELFARHSLMDLNVACHGDLGGRPYWAWQAPMPSPKIGDFDSELVADFWQAVAVQGRMNLHVLLHYGRNTHHVSEAIFKGLARSLRDAAERDPRRLGIPSTKGSL